MVPADVADSEQQRLLSRFGRRFFAGDVIFTDGDIANEAFLLQEGRVRLVKRVGATERSLRVLRPGDLFGESALLQGAPRNSTAVALENGAVLVLDQATFHHALSGNPAVGVRVTQQLVRRLRDAEDQIEILMVRDTHSKVVLALLKLAQQLSPPGVARDGASGDESATHRGAGLQNPAALGPAVLTISPLELSARVGLEVDVVKRTIQSLREGDYVRITDERVEIPDLGALHELVGLLSMRDEIRGPHGEPSERHPTAVEPVRSQ